MTCSYDDRASNGRLVFFWPMSHCWKCRFVQRYEDDGTVGKETPRQTAFKAHPAGNCAEDLCHALCIYIVLEPCRSAKPYVLVVNCCLLQRLQQVVHRHRLVGMPHDGGTRGHQPLHNAPRTALSERLLRRAIGTTPQLAQKLVI
jgi:hypothetical protein